MVELVCGVLCGRLLVGLMREWRLHWSWALVGLASVFVLRDALGGAVAAPLGVMLLTATLRGHRRHRQELLSGAELAGAAEARGTPFELVRRALWDRNSTGPGLILGVDQRKRPLAIPIGDAHGGAHTLVVGASGSGKTVTQAAIAVASIERGSGVIAVDPKGDRGLRAKLWRAAQLAGRTWIEWTPAGPSVYNPYAHGSDTELADKLLAGERFTEPHYLRQAQRYLGHELRALRAAGEQTSLGTIVRYLDPRELEGLVRALPKEHARATHDYLDALTTRQRADLSGVRDRLAIMAESDVGCWLDPTASGARSTASPVDSCELLSAVRARAVVYFSLESDRRPLLGQMLGAAIVQDLLSTVAALQRDPVASLVLIDEFSAVAAEQVARLFGRARSAGMSLLLGTQELSDLRLPGRELLLEQVLGNLSTLVAHRQVVPDSAALIARIAGTRGVWRTSWHSDGRSTATRDREPLLEQAQVGALECGQAAVIVLGGAATVRIVRVTS